MALTLAMGLAAGSPGRGGYTGAPLRGTLPRSAVLILGTIARGFKLVPHARSLVLVAALIGGGAIALAQTAAAFQTDEEGRPTRPQIETAGRCLKALALLLLIVCTAAGVKPALARLPLGDDEDELEMAMLGDGDDDCEHAGPVGLERANSAETLWQHVELSTSEKRWLDGIAILLATVQAGLLLSMGGFAGSDEPMWFEVPQTLLFTM